MTNTAIINTQKSYDKFTEQKTVAKNSYVNPQKLHQEFVRLGSMRLKLKNQMLAILPEIYKNGIWKKYAGSIVEYAGKYGDIAKTTVIKRLRLEENLQNKPYLKAAIEKVGVHKVAMVAKIATPEMDKAMAENLLNMSKMAVQSLSKELRAGQDKNHEENVNNSCQSAFGGQNQQLVLGGLANQNQLRSCGAVSITKKIELDEDSTFLFLKLKAKLGKYLSDKDFLKLILKEREKQEFPEVKSRSTNKVPGKSITGDNHKHQRVDLQKNVTGETFHAGETPTDKKTTTDKKIHDNTFAETRYIRADKKRKIIRQTNEKCAYPNCNMPYKVLHHANRYSESKNHDSVIPLCKIHHEFAHNNLIQNETLGADKWKLSAIYRSDVKISNTDILYRKYRREALV